MYSKDRTYLLKQNEELFQATLNEFSSNPYDLASTNVIIKNSSYNKGSFYYRFKAKEDIYYALIDYVYTKSLALFNKDGLKLEQITNPEDLIDLLFKYTKKLFDEDNRYFDLLVRIHHENNSLKQGVINNCVESFQMRLIERLSDVLVHYDYKDLLINNINSILYTYLSDFRNIEEEKVSIKKYLFKNQRIVADNISNSSLFFSELPNYLNFILIDDINYDLSYFDEYRIKRQLLNKASTLDEIKGLFKIEDVTLTNVIESGIQRNSRDFSELLNIEAFDYANTSYKDLNYYQKIVLLTIYNTFLAKEYIIFDSILNEVEYNDLANLLGKILPKVSKVSKIIVMDLEVYPALISDYSLYRINESDFVPINITDIKCDDFTFEVMYLDDDSYNLIVLDKTSDAFYDFIKSHKVLSIKQKNKLSLKDL